MIATPSREELKQIIDELPVEVLPELASFMEYLRFKSAPTPTNETKVEIRSGSSFLLAIAGIGTSEEDDLSERVEEILADEIDPIRGWGLKEDSLL